MGQVGGSDELVLQVVEDLSAEGQVEWVQLLGSHVGWNVSGKSVLELVGTLSLSLGSKLRSKIVDGIGALGLDLGWGESTWELASERVDEIALKVMLQLVDNEELEVGLFQLGWCSNLGNLQVSWDKA